MVGAYEYEKCSDDFCTKNHLQPKVAHAPTHSTRVCEQLKQHGYPITYELYLALYELQSLQSTLSISAELSLCLYHKLIITLLLM